MDLSLRNTMADALGHRLPESRRAIGQDDGKLFASHAGHEVHGPHTLLQALGHRADDGVARHMAMGVVDGLEVVDVEHGHGQGALPCGRARLAVGIRTFWWTAEDGGTLRFGTGAGITWDSDPDAEWHETELKARRLVGLASR